jgi:hypothetical protein
MVAAAMWRRRSFLSDASSNCPIPFPLAWDCQNGGPLCHAFGLGKGGVSPKILKPPRNFICDGPTLFLDHALPGSYSLTRDPAAARSPANQRCAGTQRVGLAGGKLILPGQSGAGGGHGVAHLVVIARCRAKCVSRNVNPQRAWIGGGVVWTVCVTVFILHPWIGSSSRW